MFIGPSGRHLELLIPEPHVEASSSAGGGGGVGVGGPKGAKSGTGG